MVIFPAREVNFLQIAIKNFLHPAALIILQSLTNYSGFDEFQLGI
jgi:hypothetical protein